MLTDETPDLLTVGEVAALCRVSTRTVRRMIKSGALPRVAFGDRGRVLIKRNDICALIEANYCREGEPGGRRMSRVGG